MNDTGYVTCPCCGNAVPKGKFCPECGMAFQGTEPAAEPNAVGKSKAPAPSVGSVRTDGMARVASMPPQKKALSDAGLSIVLRTMKKTIATVGGDGYSEITLYQDSAGSYWLHTYARSGLQPELHASYAATPALAKAVREYIDKKGLASWKNNRGPALCGGDYILCFPHGSEMISLSSGNMPDGMKAYSELSGMLYAEATPENRRYAEG